MPRAKLIKDLRAAARSHTNMALNVLSGIARNGASESARVGACVHLLDRGWGKADQNHTVDGDIKVTIRHILEHIDEKPVVIEGKEIQPVEAERAAEDALPGHLPWARPTEDDK